MPIVPAFDPSHLWTKTEIILQGEHGVYGEIVALYPTSISGAPDFDGPRQPMFRGRINLIATDPQNRQAQIPLDFLLPFSDPIEAAKAFQLHAEKAIEEYRTRAFRQNIIQPGIIKQ
jgi:hypothetical protein